MPPLAPLAPLPPCPACLWFPARPARFVASQISGAEIHCIVQEAGMQAVRNNRYVVLPADFEKGYKANTVKNDKDFEFYK